MLRSLISVSFEYRTRAKIVEGGAAGTDPRHPGKMSVLLRTFTRFGAWDEVSIKANLCRWAENRVASAPFRSGRGLALPTAPTTSTSLRPQWFERFEPRKGYSGGNTSSKMTRCGWVCASRPGLDCIHAFTVELWKQK